MLTTLTLLSSWVASGLFYNQLARRAKHVLLRLMTYVIGLSGGAIAGLIFSLLALIYLDAQDESIFMKIVAAAILGGMLGPLYAKLARRSIAA